MDYGSGSSSDGAPCCSSSDGAPVRNRGEFCEAEVGTIDYLLRSIESMNGAAVGATVSGLVASSSRRAQIHGLTVQQGKLPNPWISGVHNSGHKVMDCGRCWGGTIHGFQQCV